MGNQTNASSTVLVEPLTRREQDILKLLALNLTDREIADRLTLALSSVKWYARQVYAKLAVENRHQAVAKAAELGLLPRSTLSRRAHNLPRQITRLIGREKEIARVVELVREYSLITLTGPGGVGKTRLALAAAEELLDDFANGIWFVEIAPLSDPLLVERTLADVLGVDEGPGRLLRDSLIRFLQERQTLLILDNCEHMLDACAALAADLLKRLPDLKVFVSSREPLGVTGEAVFRVPSLSFPPDDKNTPPDHLLQFEAVNLFVERARSALPDYQLSQQNLTFIAQICRRLDGIPLAIELAASRVPTLGVAQIAARLDQAFRLLSGGSHNGLDRHRTLRAAVDWSYNLLAEKERLLLRRLSVFVGGCTFEAAESVCSGEGICEGEILDLLSRLVDKSMLVVQQTEFGDTRYHLLETIRQYAEEKQDSPAEIECLRSRHCDWFVRFAERAEWKLHMGDDDRVWNKKLAADVDNMRAALEWSIDQHADPQAGMRIINALAFALWMYYPHANDAQQWAEKGMTQLSGLASVSPLLQARSLVSLNTFHMAHNHPPDMQLFEQIVELCQKLGDEGVLIHAMLLCFSGWVIAEKTGDLKTGLDMLIQSEAMLRPIGKDAQMTMVCCLTGLTWVYAQLGDLERALAYAQERSDITHEMGSMHADIDISLGDVLYWLGNYEAAEKIYQKAILTDPETDDFYRKLGDVYRAQHRYDQAISIYREGLLWVADYSHWYYVVWLQCCFAFTAVSNARDLPPEAARPLLTHAARILGALQPVMAETGEIFPIEYRDQYDRDLAFLRERLDPAAFDSAWAQGRAMNRKQVVAYLLEEGDHPAWEINQP